MGGERRAEGGPLCQSLRAASSVQRNLVKISNFPLTHTTNSNTRKHTSFTSFFPSSSFFLAGRRKVNRRLMDLTHGPTSGATSTALVREMDMLSGHTHTRNGKSCSIEAEPHLPLRFQLNRFLLCGIRKHFNADYKWPAKVNKTLRPYLICRNIIELMWPIKRAQPA